MTHPTTKGDLQSSVTQIMLMLRALDKRLQDNETQMEQLRADLRPTK